MAQSGFTPISIYYSSTASAVPLAANLAFGELALNILDGKLYFKNSVGAVTLLSSSTTSGGAFTTLSYSTSFTGNGPATITDNSSSAALRITQTGSGNALLVEDSANPDATPFVVDQNGAVGIGGNPSAGVNLYNTRDLSGAVTAFGTSTASTIRSSVTTAAYGFQSLLATESAAFTLPTLVHYSAAQSTFANTSVTTQAGFQSQSNLIGAVDNFGFFAANTAAVTAGKNAYGFYSAVNTATGGGTAYAIYTAGTAPSVFTGSVTFTDVATFTGTPTGTGLTARFSTPGPIGNTSASTGAFTTCTATTFSGSGASLTSIPAGQLTGDVPKAALATNLNASGSAPFYVARAWVNFNGTGTPAIRASGNVTSITDNGTGDYTVNFTTAMPDANYAPVGLMATLSGGEVRSIAGGPTYAQTASSLRVQTWSSTALGDAQFVTIAIFR